MMFVLLAALLIGSPAKTAAENDLYIYDQSVVPDTISGPTNVTCTGSVMNERTYAITLKHFWIAISNKSGELQSFNMTYSKLELPINTSKTELMTVLIANLTVGDYNVTMKFSYTTPFNATEVNVLPDVNVTLAVVEPQASRPRLLLYFFLGTGAFIVAILIIGVVGNHLERKRRRKG